MSISLNKNNKKSFFMELALNQAYRSLGNSGKNPSVGCVIVKDNCVISSGFTATNGRPHAEYVAINNSNCNIKGSDIFVTLEPCSHYGKTPPCTNLIIKKKLRRVYFASNDPDIRSFNKCIKKLNKYKIEVISGVLKNKIDNFYSSYFNFKKKLLPFVTAKIAVSKDFYTVNNKKKWITNHHSRARVHLLRSKHDCIITSSKTVLCDNPKLTCRIKGLEYTSPLRIILDKDLKISINSKILKHITNTQTIIFHNSLNVRKLAKLKKINIKTIKSRLDKNEKLDLYYIVLKLRKMGFSRIFLEAGLNLTSAFLKKKLINDFILFVSKDKIKSNGSNNFKFIYNKYLKKLKSFNSNVNLFGDKLILYKIK